MDTRSRTTVVARVVTALALTAVLAACGRQADPPTAPSESTSSAATTTSAADVPPEELLEEAMRNMREAPSKRVTGMGEVAGSTQEFEVVFVGEDAKGTQIGRAMGLESVVEFVRAGDSLYILGGEPYWQWYVGLQDLYLVSGHWVRVPANHPTHKALLVIEDNPELTEPIGELTRAGTDSVDGTPAVDLEDGAGNRFFVSADGTPYLLRVEATQDTESGRATVEVTISDFGTVTETITAPSGEIVELH
jgi:hypothetical protein